LVASAYAARIARRAAEYGVMMGGDIGIDMRRVKARTDAIVAASRNGLTSALVITICIQNNRRSQACDAARPGHGAQWADLRCVELPQKKAT